MPAFRNAALLALTLLALICGPASAEDSYKVEIIVFTQPGEPIASSHLAPNSWNAGATPISDTQTRATSLNDEAAKLSPENGYTVLLHQAWTQTISDSPSTVAITNGERSLGHFPLEGTLTFTQDRNRTFKLDSQIWRNQFGADGLVDASEHLSQKGTPVTRGKLTFVDQGHMGVLIRVR